MTNKPRKDIEILEKVEIINSKLDWIMENVEKQQEFKKVEVIPVVEAPILVEKVGEKEEITPPKAESIIKIQEINDKLIEDLKREPLKENKKENFKEWVSENSITIILVMIVLFLAVMLVFY
jgi:MinD-like ATPase involved in chromosome partitioning or flagellar assembly